MNWHVACKVPPHRVVNAEACQPRPSMGRSYVQAPQKIAKLLSSLDSQTFVGNLTWLMGVKLHQHTNWRVPQLVSIEAAKKWSCRNDRNDTWLMGSSWLMDADLRSNLMEGLTSFLFKSWLDNQLFGQGCNHQNFMNLPSTPWIRNPDLPIYRSFHSVLNITIVEIRQISG